MPDEHTFADTGTRLHKRWVIVDERGRRVTLYKALGSTADEVRKLYPHAQLIEPLD